MVSAAAARNDHWVRGKWRGVSLKDGGVQVEKLEGWQLEREKGNSGEGGQMSVGQI